MTALARLTALPAQPPMAVLTQAALAFGQLSQALDNHALLPAILYRARLIAAGRAAAADGQLIDPWKLAALLAGLRLDLGDGDTIAARADVLAKARHALDVHQWLVDPDFDQEGEVDLAGRALAAADTTDGPLLAAARAFHAWIDADRPRQPMRTALARYWKRQGLFAVPVPIIAASSLAADTPWELDEWLSVFLHSIATEASELVQLSRTLERAWRAARQALHTRRKTSHAAGAVDVLAAAPLISSPTLAVALSIAPKNAGRLLDELCREGAAIEVTRRAKRRLYALPTMEPLRDATVAPRRPEPGRERGRPTSPIPDLNDETFVPAPIVPKPRLPPMSFDYADLDAAMAALDARNKLARATLHQIGQKPI